MLSLSRGLTNCCDCTLRSKPHGLLSIESIFATKLTTSLRTQWALIELARNPEKQDKLRQELTNASPSNMDQATYLAAVVREIIRLYPPVGQLVRMVRFTGCLFNMSKVDDRIEIQASQDDVVPLSDSIVDLYGRQLQSFNVAKGSVVNIPLRAINHSQSIWGPEAKSFLPERWLDNESGIPARAKEMPGYHHILTFIDGPRTCLGRNIALEEMKVSRVASAECIRING